MQSAEGKTGMYKLTLTQKEREAIDFVGNRYSNGYDLFRLLWAESICETRGQDWDSEWDLEFSVPENIAWQIKANNDEEDSPWPCFAPELAAKMQNFVEQIV